MLELFSKVYHKDGSKTDDGDEIIQYIEDIGKPDVKGKYYSGYRCISSYCQMESMLNSNLVYFTMKTALWFSTIKESPRRTRR